LITNGTCQSFDEPLGTPHPDWPDWAKPNGVPGTVRFIGDQPYTEATPRQKRGTYHDFDPDGEVIRLRSASVRQAIPHYLPAEAFMEWTGHFLDSLDIPAYYYAVVNSLDRVPVQFNMRPAEKMAPDEVVRKYLDRSPQMARYALSRAHILHDAPDYPELVLTMALFQAAHKPFLDNVEGGLYLARLEGQIDDEQLDNATAVLRGPFKQFGDFLVYATLLPLVLLEYKDLTPHNPEAARLSTRRTVMPDAIQGAWDIFIWKRLLRRDFADGSRMICPANQYLAAIKKARLLETIYATVLDRRTETPVCNLLQYARVAALRGSFHKTSNFYRAIHKAVNSQVDVRGGKGLLP
jgi:hypothetical protein